MKQIPVRSTLAFALVGLVAAGGTIAAEPQIKGVAAVIENLLACRTKTDSTERLACYDAIIPTLDTAVRDGDIMVIDRQQAQAARRQAFGLSLPSLSMFDRAEKPEDVDRLVATVENAYRNRDGKWVFELEGGAVWTQIDAQGLTRDPKKGSKVEIRRAAMGSFFLRSDDQRGMRARRVN